MHWPRKKTSSGFVGSWHYRVGDLFDCGVNFGDRTVLDAGCNMGVLAYEIAKQNPKFIHGIDRKKRYVDVAQMIFLGATVESQFDKIDLAPSSALATLLAPAYDIILYLSVHQHIYGRRGRKVAERTLRFLLSRCREHFIFRVNEPFLSEAEAIVIADGFEKTFTGERLDDGSDRFNDENLVSRFHVYRRHVALPASSKG